MVVAHNMMAMNAQRQYNITGLNQKKSTEKLSSGYKINRAADDAAGLAISEKMRKQISGLDRGTDNMQDGVSWVQIGDGAMTEVHDILQRMTELSVQGANGTLSPEDRQAIDKEIQQLKVEINRINETTKFNDKRIFSTDDRAIDDNGELIIEKLEGNPTDLKIFDATYDDVTGAVTYGGIVFDGNRISWDTIDPNMVYIDGGKQKFHEGTWVYVDANNRKLSFSAKEGDEVPSITRNFNISANTDGLLIDGELIKWEDIKCKSGETMAQGYLNEKTWTADYHGAKLTFQVNNAFLGIKGLVDAIKEGNESKRYSVYATYAGSSEVQAVDADINNSQFAIRSTEVAKNVVAGNGYTLRAGDGTNGYDGLWLEDANGNEVNGSFQSWASMGINSWDSGSDIKAEPYLYKYKDTDGVNDTSIEFPFTLSDITSKDSVIDGLDGVRIDFENVTTNYGHKIALDGSYPNVLSAVITQEITRISLQDELDLGRDFDRQTQDVSNGVWDGNAFLFQDNSGNTVVRHRVSNALAGTKILDCLPLYENSIIETKVMQTLTGLPNTLNLGPKDLKDLLGAGKITTSGNMSDTVTITSTMDRSDGPNQRETVVVGRTYPCGTIDFSGLGVDYNIWELTNSGFDSTCGGCDKHYSVKFVFDTEGYSQIDGYRYRLDTSKGAVKGSAYAWESDYDNKCNPVLEISVSSLVEQGVTTGAQLASAIVKIASQGFDEHNQAYAADGDKLYIHEVSQGYDNAEFHTTTYDVSTRDDFVITHINRDSQGSVGGFRVNYKYDYSDYKDWIAVDMVLDDTSGLYVQKAGGGYEEYDPVRHAGSHRYNLQVSYADAANGVSNSSLAGTKTVKVGGKTMALGTLGDRDSSMAAYMKKATDDMNRASLITLQARDYTRADMFGNENPNVAIKSNFDAYSAMVPEPTRHGVIKYEDSIMILKSGDASNKLIIPRFSLNTACLGLNRANCVTQNSSRNTIDMVNRALGLVSERRSLYGALQNRMEHAIRSNENTEENTTAAESRIRDTDMAEEMVNYAKNNILAQAGESMLAQANQMNQGVLSLLQ